MWNSLIIVFVYKKIVKTLFGTMNKQMQLKYLDKYLCKICIYFAHMLCIISVRIVTLMTTIEPDQSAMTIIRVLNLKC